jgi:hypothetical protein
MLILRIAAAAALLSLPHSAPAMTVVDRDFADLVAHAEQIVVGTVTAIEAGENERGGPMTFISFNDLTVLKGDVAPPFVLQIHGGLTRDGVLMHVPDLPTFRVGERAVLFVRGNGRDFCPLVGIWQGRFEVRHDPDLGIDVVERHDGTVVTGMTAGNLESAQRRSAGARPLSLDDFGALIREELTHPSK